METIENIHVFNAILLAVVVTVIGIVGGGRKFYCVKFFFCDDEFLRIALFKRCPQGNGTVCCCFDTCTMIVTTYYCPLLSYRLHKFFR